jgi:glycosyltransferase involved in cell wall biosynthesis
MMNKNKILYIEEATDFGGSLIVMATIVNNLSSRTESFVNIEMDSFNDLSSDKNVSLIKHKVNYSHIVAAKSYLFKKISSILLRRVISVLLDTYRILCNAPYIYKLCKLVKDNKIDIIHLNNALGNGEANIVCLIMNVEVLVHLHGVSSPGRIAKFLMKNKRVHYLSISEYIAREMYIRGVEKDKTTVLLNPYFERKKEITTHELNQIKSELAIDKNDLLIGIVGRIVDWKGQLEVVKAFVKVKSEIENVKLLIIGGPSDGVDNYYDDLCEFIEQSGLSKDVIITGYKQNVDHYYELLDVCIHASTTPEPFGLVIIEAMARAKAVIAANTGATCEIIDHEIDGYLIDVFDEEAFAQRIIQLLNSEQLRADIGKKAKQKVKNKFEAQQYVEKLEALYNEILLIKR